MARSSPPLTWRMPTGRAAATRTAWWHRRRTCFGAPTATSRCGARISTATTRSTCHRSPRCSTPRKAACTWTWRGRAFASEARRNVSSLTWAIAGWATTRSSRFTSCAPQPSTCAAAAPSAVRRRGSGSLRSWTLSSSRGYATSCSAPLGAAPSATLPTRWPPSTDRSCRSAPLSSMWWVSASFTPVTALTTSHPLPAPSPTGRSRVADGLKLWNYAMDAVERPGDQNWSRSSAFADWPK
mmetsp:Transcript_18626/g.44214  ORF Transcript_18626/g.44214 Transcript_18626/m.44214 type:complete len:240 (+) Transcript_18626:248-967(+)